MRSSMVLPAALLVLPLGDAHAQLAQHARSESFSGGRVAAFSIGQRVRLSVPRLGAKKLVGTIKAAAADTFQLDTTEVWKEQRRFFPTAVPVDEYRHITLSVAAVEAIEVSDGRNKVLGAVKHGLRGVVIGGLLAGTAGVSGKVNPSFRDFMSGFTVGASIGGVIGAPLGYMRGAELWRRIPIPGRPGRAPAPQIAGGR